MGLGQKAVHAAIKVGSQPGKFACFAQYLEQPPATNQGGLHFWWWLLMLYEQLICQLAAAWTDWWGCWLESSRKRKQAAAIRWRNVNGRHELPVTWKVFLHFPSVARARHVFACFPAHPRWFFCAWSELDWTVGLTRTLPGICRPPRACGTLSLSVAAPGACVFMSQLQVYMLRTAFSLAKGRRVEKLEVVCESGHGACAAQSSRGNCQKSHIVGVRTNICTLTHFGKCQCG